MSTSKYQYHPYVLLRRFPFEMFVRIQGKLLEILILAEQHLHIQMALSRRVHDGSVCIYVS
eukprot:CAMPEP_0172510254 /NCGR_PEP_ID=MMETSP1066-20121228/227331_1 /TAXON_ID=671091 /ORGANISM="Coscinodiscus wailesii, Strain CCMP2513" /LENGTH=60 /DNA_ID=CAMNT_0013289129 /DNA_START=144 /DNA_END=326 /DNA_ORIENTATION=+